MISRSDTRIIQGFGAAFAFLLVAKIVGAAKEVVIAHEYGTSSAVDAYALGFVLANWPVSLGAMCANMLLIPLFVERRHKTGSEVDSLSALTLWASYSLSGGKFGRVWFFAVWRRRAFKLVIAPQLCPSQCKLPVLP